MKAFLVLNNFLKFLINSFENKNKIGKLNAVLIWKRIGSATQRF